MITICPACSTRYDVPDDSIGPEGRTLRCAKCRESWFQEGPEGLVEPVPDAAAQAPPPSDPLDEEPSAPPPVAGVTVALDPAATPALIDPPEAGAATDRWYEETPSSFAHEPPFQPRRNRAKTWLMAALAFLLLALAIGAAIAWKGAPEWMPMSRQAIARSHPGLVLDFPPSRLDRRTLANGTEYFGASGTITNVGQSRQEVPPIRIVLRDQQQRIVYRWDVIPPRRHLGAGETMTINEAVTDIPPSARLPEIGWKPV
ncbi:MAG: zinc-ribbon domain-containing protein [Novosphingobium sp.]